VRAFVLTRYGGPEATEIRDMPVPEASPGHVVVRVRAAGLNPLDFKIRAGKLKVIRRFPLPIVMGNELAGVVERVGEGVTRFAPGDEVFARVAKDDLGALAELASLPEATLATKPAALDFTAAAAVPLAALTALQALRDELHVAGGQAIFISAGAGGVGTFAIQIAKLLGARVATTASPRGDALVRRLGADVVVDYTTARFEDAIRGQDGAFDLVGGDTLARTFAVVKRGGRVVSIAGLPEPRTAADVGGGARLRALFWLASLPTRLRARGVDYRYLFMHPSGADLEQIATWIDRRELEVVVDRVFPFEQVGEALAYLESGRAKGKVVVEVAR
jgi:NADPH:quinone reductase-like Zn-dependent oxidoreductase